MEQIAEARDGRFFPLERDDLPKEFSLKCGRVEVFHALWKDLGGRLNFPQNTEIFLGHSRKHSKVA